MQCWNHTPSPEMPPFTLPSQCCQIFLGRTVQAQNNIERGKGWGKVDNKSPNISLSCLNSFVRDWSFTCFFSCRLWTVIHRSIEQYTKYLIHWEILWTFRLYPWLSYTNSILHTYLHYLKQEMQESRLPQFLREIKKKRGNPNTSIHDRWNSSPYKKITLVKCSKV